MILVFGYQLIGNRSYLTYMTYMFPLQSHTKNHKKTSRFLRDIFVIFYVGALLRAYDSDFGLCWIKVAVVVNKCA